MEGIDKNWIHNYAKTPAKDSKKSKRAKTRSVSLRRSKSHEDQLTDQDGNGPDLNDLSNDESHSNKCFPQNNAGIGR